MIKKNDLKIFETKEDLINNLAEEFVKMVSSSKGKINVALAGGGTPKPFYERLATSTISSNINWNKVHFFWGDERCVPPDDSESNFGMVKSALFDKIEIPDQNIHRVKCEKTPPKAAKKYEIEIINNLSGDSYPKFDWVFLGLGGDGHTASLFPESENLDNDEDICVIATHPESAQKRISLSLPVLNSAKRVSFLVTGQKKKDILEKVVSSSEKKEYPATFIKPVGKLEVYADKAAAQKVV